MNGKNLNANQLREKCRISGKSFVDLDFPPNNTILTSQMNSIKERRIVWKRPSELSDKPYLFTDNCHPSVIQQGCLGNCWFVAACSCLSTWNLAYKLITHCYPTWDDYYGIFEFRFWRYGTWINVLIDDFLPTSNNELVYCHSSDKNEFWCALLEKAYAKVLGSYEALEGGELADVLTDFTGGFTQWIDLIGNEKLINGSSSVNIKLPIKVPNNPDYLDVPSNQIYDYLLRCYLDKSLIAAALSAIPTDKPHTQTINGLVNGHAYAITAIISIPYSTELQQNVHLLRLFNPWGEFQWKSSLSTQSNIIWENISSVYRDYIHLNKCVNGEFWIELNEFLRYFNYIVICHRPLTNLCFKFTSNLNLIQFKQNCEILLKNNDSNNVQIQSNKFLSFYQNHKSNYIRSELYFETNFHGSWYPGLDGGCLNNLDTFANNPQFAFTVNQLDGLCVLIHLIQKTVRHPISSTSSTGLFHIGMSIFKINTILNKSIKSFTYDYLLCSSIYRNSRSTFVHLNLNYGHYIVIPTTYQPQCHTEFMLRLFSTHSIYAVQINPEQVLSNNFLCEQTQSHSSPFLLSENKYNIYEHFCKWVSRISLSNHHNLIHKLRNKWKKNFCRIIDPQLNTTFSHGVSSNINNNYYSLNLTLLHAFIWPLSTHYMALNSSKSVSEKLLLNSYNQDYYISVSTHRKDGHKPELFLSSSHKVQIFPKFDFGFIPFGEMFLFTNYLNIMNKKSNSIIFKVWLKNPIFDELHSSVEIQPIPIFNQFSFILKIPLFVNNHNKTALNAFICLNQSEPDWLIDLCCGSKNMKSGSVKNTKHDANQTTTNMVTNFENTDYWLNHSSSKLNFFDQQIKTKIDYVSEKILLNHKNFNEIIYDINSTKLNTVNLSHPIVGQLIIRVHFHLPFN